ncbi:DNA polymerase III subunit delta' [Candidatus Thiosymbion oneisti]|uniref:DNA polymerase III subunit delta' n=1 Tax=Candidatus Thiosymbion oneisti TaxID=589554 RepID=UPI000AFBBAF8|nr:DNA polymerase III subunit delta' [Candidatus Thiosymbion oneisti]
MSPHTEAEAPLPWHAAGWQLLRQARAAGRLPHALLVTGPPGVGKRRLVRLLSRSLLCARPDAGGLACGHCRECELFAAGTHPDYLEIGPDPESKSDEIRVDAIRRLAASDALTAHRGGHKVIVLDPAQNMNLNAANSLLKTLEEPSPDTFLCLVCEQPGRLPATIRSRCQELRVPVPSEPQALEWLRAHTDSADAETLLRLAYGAPLRALALEQENRRQENRQQEDRLSQRTQAFAGFIAVAGGTRDPVAEAVAWNDHEPAILLDWLYSWVSDLLRLASGHPAPRLINQDQLEALRNLAQRLEPRAGHLYLMQLMEARADGYGSVNRLLLYESLLVHWARIFRSRDPALRQPGWQS